jgi:hypothetical protein
MRDAQKPDHMSLTALIARLREGRFVIPDFQREFEWEPADIRDLMRSIFLDYYIGSLLIWKGKPENFEALACEPLYGYINDGQNTAEHIVLDGQQRLTAMYYTFIAPDVPAPNRSNRYVYFISVDRFMDEAYDEAFSYDWTRRGLRTLRDPVSQYDNHIFPLSIVGKGGWALYDWVQGYENHWSERAADPTSIDPTNTEAASRHARNARAFGQHLKDITESYQVSYIELDRDLELDKVCDIFTQINSRGIRLDVFDLINALLKPRGLRLKHMWRKASASLDFVQTRRMNVYILQLMSIALQAYCSPKYLYYLLPGQQKKVRQRDGSLQREVLISDTSQFEQHWNDAVEAMKRAIDLLRHPQEFGAVSSEYMPYVSILPVFAALQAEARELDPNRRLDAQRKIRHWYWASVFTNRYSGSVESTAARDFIDVRAWLADDVVEPGLIAEFKARFQTLELRRETKRGTSVYNGVFNLLVLRGARDWITGNVPQHGDLDDHHIVPKKWGADNIGLEIDTILNRTPLTADTNRHVIGDRLPNAYLPELIAASGESTVRTTLESHFISPVATKILLRSPFTPDDYDAFLAERQKTIRGAIEDLLIKERIDLPPQLRELDSRIEAVELQLQSTIAVVFDSSSMELPSGIAQRINERIQRAARKNPALDTERYEEVGAMLEYADLRELEMTMVNKSVWPLFSVRFAGKEMLATRFGQLAELRNGIRHSRAVDDITRKEGEAAILWFEQILRR